MIFLWTINQNDLLPCSTEPLYRDSPEDTFHQTGPVVQWLRCHPYEVVTVGPIPTRPTISYGSIERAFLGSTYVFEPRGIAFHDGGPCRGAAHAGDR